MQIVLYLISQNPRGGITQDPVVFNFSKYSLKLSISVPISTKARKTSVGFTMVRPPCSVRAFDERQASMKSKNRNIIGKIFLAIVTTSHHLSEQFQRSWLNKIKAGHFANSSDRLSHNFPKAKICCGWRVVHKGGRWLLLEHLKNLVAKIVTKIVC